VGASRVASLSMYRHAVALTPVGSPWGSSCSPDLATAAFPILLTGRLPHQPFRGLLGVHGCYGLPARGAACAALSIEGFGSFVTSTTAPIATGWSNSCRVGLTPTEERHLSTAHKRTGLVKGMEIELLPPYFPFIFLLFSFISLYFLYFFARFFPTATLRRVAPLASFGNLGEAFPPLVTREAVLVAPCCSASSWRPRSRSVFTARIILS
jgi:hypothetical protein